MANSLGMEPQFSRAECVGQGIPHRGHALELIRKLLDLARAEAGELALHHESIDLTAVVREVAEAFGSQAQAPGGSISVENHSGRGCTFTLRCRWKRRADRSSTHRGPSCAS
jgi:hypothetical protein